MTDPRRRRAALLAATIAFAIVALVSRPPEARCWGFRAGERSLGLRLGVTDPTGTGGLDATTRRGMGVGLGHTRYLADWFAWGVEADGLFFRKENDPLGPGLRRLGGTSMAFLGTGRFNLVFDRPWTVYLLGGAGVHRTNGKLETAAFSRSVTDDGFAVVAAGGAETFLMMDLSARFEARFNAFRLDANKFGVDSAEFLSYQLGVSYWFGVR